MPRLVAKVEQPRAIAAVRGSFAAVTFQISTSGEKSPIDLTHLPLALLRPRTSLADTTLVHRRSLTPRSLSSRTLSTRRPITPSPRHIIT
ncbi:hypothetical protein VTO73DRAFT_2220 [Trametes versicolor]